MSRIARWAVLVLGLYCCLASGIGEARESGARGLAVISVAQLPPEARETIALIRDGGPFPYGRDGSVFANREGLLPSAPRGSYREYTVKTPGRRDRGARRIVSAPGGQLYYTADHYSSFRLILE
jgi:ribonuclease T1